MRYLLPALLILLAGCAATLPPAAPADEPMQGANRLIIQTPDAPDDAYRKIAQLLMQRGYQLAHSDASLRTVATEDHVVRGSIAMRVRATVQDTAGGSEVHLMGDSRVPGLGGPMRVAKRGQSGSIMMQSYEILHELATSYEPGTVIYARD